MNALFILGLVFFVLFLLVIVTVVDCLERLVSKMTDYESSARLPGIVMEL